MSIDNLLSHIEILLKEKGLSERKACLDADVGPDFIRDMRRNGNFPKVDKLMKLANTLNVNINYFLNAINPKISSIKQPVIKDTAIPFKTIYIKGSVQAGQWTNAAEWPESEWIAFPTPINPRYKNFHTFALSVKGDSMNLLYPEGTIIIVVNFSDLGRNPDSGECVVTMRRDPLTDCYEATLKVVEIKKDGRILLWPRSNNPDFVKPIILPRLTTRYQGNGFDGDTAAAPDIVIQSLVIGCYNNIEKVSL